MGGKRNNGRADRGGSLAMPDIEACVRELQTAILMGSGERREWAIRVWTRLGYPRFWS